MRDQSWRANRWMVTLLVLLVSGLARAEDAKTVRLLTVGNSFADNALVFLPKIAESGGQKLIFAKANIGGCTMERHWRHASAYEASKDDPNGRPYAGNKKSLAELLQTDRWDVVTIQQQSLQSCDVATFEPFAQKLHEYITARCAGAKVLIHQTWAYRIDDPLYKGTSGAGPKSHKEMYEKTRAAYRQIAGQLKIGIIPAGEAMFRADTDAQWGYRPDTAFDFAHAKKADLPNQLHSLHMGWSWKKGPKDDTEKLSLDGHHANVAGQYLIACVWYETLFGADVTKVTFAPKGVEEAYAAFLRQTAHQAVKDLTTAAMLDR